MKDIIDHTRAKLEGDTEGQLEIDKYIFENRLGFYGENLEETIMAGVL